MRAKVIAVLAALFMAAFSVTVSAPAAKADINPCQRAMFFGAHGVNEGAAGTGWGTAHWGTPEEYVFSQFQMALLRAHKPLPMAESVDYPKVRLDPKASSWIKFFQAVGALNVAIEGASSLQIQLENEHKACPDQAFVISGYSQGAWVVDLALHNLYSSSKTPFLGATDLAVLHQIKYVFLMGDPATPEMGNAPGPPRYGIASRHRFGYPDLAAYSANGIPRASFVSACLTGDPICNGASDADITDASINVHAKGYFTTPVVCDTGGGDLDNLTYPIATCGGSTMAAMAVQ